MKSDDQGAFDLRDGGNQPWFKADRNGTRLWTELARDSKNAVLLMGILLQRIGEANAVVATHGELAAELRVKSRNTVKSALRTLQEHGLIEIWRQEGASSPHVYVISERVAWVGKDKGDRRARIMAQLTLHERVQEPGAVDAACNGAPLRRLDNE